jgi:hypothetical protein
MENLIAELGILLSERKTKCRLRQWMKHARTFVKIDRAGPKEPKELKQPEVQWGSERIEFAFNHLNILDTKFGFLLSMQAFLGAGVGFAVVAFPWDKVPAASGVLAFMSPWIWSMLILGLTVLWGFNVIFTLIGMSRLVWGDLWENNKDLNAAEEKHVRVLLFRVVKRTARFRVAMVLTGIGVVWGCLLTSTIVLLKQQGPPSKAHTGEVNTRPENSYEIVKSDVYERGHLSHSHTFLMNKDTGAVWQMTCRKGKTVEFRLTSRIPSQDLPEISGQRKTSE